MLIHVFFRLCERVESVATGSYPYDRTWFQSMEREFPLPYDVLLQPRLELSETICGESQTGRFQLPKLMIQFGLEGSGWG
jgi:hypothetical protein